MLARVNPNPRFLKAVADGGFLEPAPFTVADVGAAGGFFPYWIHFGKHKRLIGFEPDAKECARLREVRGLDIFPVALGRRRESRVFFMANNHTCSSMMDINREYWARFPMDGTHELVGKHIIETVDLDGFAAENGIGDIDFIKLDTEGTELEILEGAERLLQDKIIAIEVEVAFQPIHHGRPLFGDVDAYLRKQGFAMFDLAPWRHARRALPPLEDYAVSPSPYGQIVWGEALYMKDLSALIAKGERPDPMKILKLACLFDLFLLPDCAIELLEAALGAKLIDEVFLSNLELLVPYFLGRSLPLAAWRALFNVLPQV